MSGTHMDRSEQHTYGILAHRFWAAIHRATDEANKDGGASVESIRQILIHGRVFADFSEAMRGKYTPRGAEKMDACADEIAEARQKDETIARLRAALRKHGYHTPVDGEECGALLDGACGCGLNAALGGAA